MVSRVPPSPGWPHPQVLHMSTHLHRDDSQLPATENVEIRTATRAQHDRLVEGELLTARSTVRPPRRLVDVQPSPLQPGPTGHDLETEPHQISHQPRQPPDLQTHRHNRSVADL